MSSETNEPTGTEKPPHPSKAAASQVFSAGIEAALQLRKQRVKAIQQLQELRKSTVFVLWTIDDLKHKDFFTLADMLEEENPSSDIDLVVLSHGGSGEAGYRIGHTFQGWARRKQTLFRVIIPLYAKSAGTIAALGAHELVMGLTSEIGPIDPQIPRYDRTRGQWTYIPAMAVLDGLKLVSEHIQQIPQMSRFFEEIVKNEGLSLVDLGLLERMRESGKQYTEALLIGGMQPNKDEARATSDRLTDFYKYHGHPIDSFEIEGELKLKVRHSVGDEWRTIKTVRDEFQSFVGQPGLIPGTIVTCAIETANFRSWRYQALEEGRQHASTFQEKIGGVSLEIK